MCTDTCCPPGCSIMACEAAQCMQAYASVQLNQDLGYSDSVYGAAAGVFFVSYAVFQVI